MYNYSMHACTGVCIVYTCIVSTQIHVYTRRMQGIVGLPDRVAICRYECGESDGAWTHTLLLRDTTPMPYTWISYNYSLIGRHFCVRPWQEAGILSRLYGRGGGQSEHEREREGGRKGRTLQPAHTRTGVPSLWIRMWAEAKGKTALNSAHFHVHVYTPTVQLRWQIRRGAHFQRILISATARTLSLRRLRDSARGLSKEYPGCLVSS